jgi:hypothetical protein
MATGALSALPSSVPMHAEPPAGVCWKAGINWA